MGLPYGIVARARPRSRKLPTVFARSGARMGFRVRPAAREMRRNLSLGMRRPGVDTTANLSVLFRVQ